MKNDIKKSLKYIMIVVVNLLILTILLAIWTDRFEVEFNDLVRPIAFLKLLGISLIGLILLRILVAVFREFQVVSSKRKMSISIIAVVLVSSYFYVDYGMKIYANRIVNGGLRNVIVEKIKPREMGLASGRQANNLTNQEYTEITKIKWFPKLPPEAANISYRYDYDGFLPDYHFLLSYDLPLESKVDTMSYENNTFSRARSLEIIGNKKRVTYFESRW